MGAMASKITSLTIVYSTVYSGTDHRKRQSSASLAFVRGIHRRSVNEFPAQTASNAENVSIWWRHHVLLLMWHQTNSPYVAMNHLQKQVHLDTVQSAMPGDWTDMGWITTGSTSTTQAPNRKKTNVFTPQSKCNAKCDYPAIPYSEFVFIWYILKSFTIYNNTVLSMPWKHSSSDVTMCDFIEP